MDSWNQDTVKEKNQSQLQNIIEKEKMLEAILDDSNQMIQISDFETYRMLYANKPAQIFTGHAERPYKGKLCYEYMMGLKEQCPFCPMLKMNGEECQETEVDNGEQIFAVKTKIVEWKGDKAFIEYAWDITQLRRSQKIFESQMHTLIQSIPDAQGIFHLDLTDNICLSINGASKTVEDMEQKTTVDVLVKNVGSFVPDEVGKQEFFDFFCRDSLIKAYQNGKVQISKETDSYFDDGSIRSARITARLIMNPATEHLECVIYGMDITEEKQEKLEYEAHIKEQLDIFDALSKDYLNVFFIDAESETVKILKLEGYITEGLDKNSNREYPYNALCSQYINERVHPDEKEAMMEAMKLQKVEKILDKNQEYVSSYRVLIQGDTHYCQFKYIRLPNTSHIIAGFQNIDVIIAKEREIQNKLTQALEKAEQSNRAKTIFLNSMSHDIRTPLNAIVGCTALATARVDEVQEVKKYLSKIGTASNHLLSLINDVLDMSHIESGAVKIENAQVYLPAVLEDLKSIVQSNSSARRLELDMEMKELEHKDIITDKLRLNQVLLNILGNAVKFTRPGGKIYFQIREIKEQEPEYAKYEFRVRDTGIGMSEEFMEHIFEPFSREQTSTVSGIEGTGLGMSIAKNIVDMMGGTITVKSRQGEGTEFIVILKFKVSSPPIANEMRMFSRSEQMEIFSEQEKLKQENLKEKSSENLFKNKKILLVEDNELNQEIAVELLKEVGFLLDTAEDGTIAVEKMQKAELGQYDLILMDIQMPIMDGYEATRQIRKLENPEIANIPIIAMTANAFEEDRQKALEAGMNEHVAKPIDLARLLKAVKKVLK